MKDLIFSPIVQLIGETLRHSIWQGAVLVLIVFILFNIINSQNSAVRYGIALAALVSLIVLNISSFLYTLPAEPHVSTTPLQQDVDLSKVESILSISSGVFPVQKSSELVSYFMIFWFAGLTFFAVRLTFIFYHTQWLKNHGVSAAPAFMDDALMMFRTKLKINRPIRIFESIRVATPCVIGHFKPILLFPLGLVNGLTTDQVESIIIHELAHIKRNDYLVNLIQSAVEIIYFFNPFIWVISNIIRQEREKACDDITLAMGIPPRTYVNTLATIFQRTYNQQELSLSFSKNNKSTLKRIRRIMTTESSNNNKMLLPLVMVVVMITSVYLGTKSPATAVFDMAPMELNPVVRASTLPDISFVESVPSPNTTNIIKLRLPEPKTPVQSQQKDTIDRDEFKQQVKDFEDAVQRLQASSEWKEMEELKNALFQQQKLFFKELSPEIEEAIKQATMSMQLSEEEILVLEKRMEQVQDQLSDVRISAEVEQALALKAEAIEKAMMKLEVKLNSISNEKLEKLAREYSEEAKMMEIEAIRMAEEANLISKEATKKAEKIERFMEEFQPMLIKDGYLKKGEEIDELRFEDGKIWVNGKEVKSSDAKRYNKTRNKYLDSNESFVLNQ